ncbi:unnamed protein product [Leptidea sinapis]|uniref:Protein kinase domain-containing protein n=1 Tax=Leptidea sinapis TaxID=189913 RepID=A0A5E4QI22_9NEOP|nr:unnamed protein product [Leptidea sinapis]
MLRRRGTYTVNTDGGARHGRSTHSSDSNYVLVKTVGKDGSKVTTVVATPGQGPDRPQEVSYADMKLIGNGSFGVVYQAKLCDTGELIAIKKVLQDKRFKKDEVYLNLVLEYIPETVYKVARHYSKDEQTIPISFIKLYMYQLFRSLAYIHSLGICHRDIKPQNLLLDPKSGVLKLCDFGSAKHLVRGEPNVSYICSRYYRAPELIFGAIDYTTKIGVDQLVEIIKVLGTPTREQIREMNPNYTEFKFPQIKSHPWAKVFRACTPPDAIALVSRLLEYTPGARLSPLQACTHAFFDELREAGARLPNGRPLPPLFNFTDYELSVQPSLNDLLKPREAAKEHDAQGVYAHYTILRFFAFYMKAREFFFSFVPFWSMMFSLSCGMTPCCYRNL